MVFDVQFGAELVELMFAALYALTQAKEAVGELFSIVREYGSDAQWTGALQVTQKAVRVGCRLAVEDDYEDGSAWYTLLNFPQN